MYEIVSQKLEQQISLLRSLDTKASILLAAISLLFAGYLQLLDSELLDYRNFLLLVVTELYFFALAIATVLWLLFFNRTLTWRDDPEPDGLVSIYSVLREDNDQEFLNFAELKSAVLDNMAEAYEENRERVRRKGDDLWWAGTLVCSGLVVLVIHLVLMLVTSATSQQTSLLLSVFR